jgi:hypothetical protein
MRKILAVLFLLVFVLTVPLSLALFKLDTILFDPQIYQDALERAQPEDELPGFAAQAAAQTQYISLAPYGNLKGIQPAPFEDMLLSLVPPARFHELALDLMSQGLQYLQLQRNEISFSLKTFREAFAGPQGLQAFKQFTSTYPKCTGAQLNSMLLKQSLVDSQGNIMLCNTPGEYHSAHGTLLFAGFLPPQVQAMAAGIPSELVLVQAPAGTQDFRSQIPPLRQKLHVAFVVPLAFLLLGSVFAVRSLRSWLKWWGAPFMAAGLLGILLSYYASPYIVARLGLLFDARMAALSLSLPAFVPVFVHDVLGAMVGQCLDFVARISLPLAAGGLLMLAVGFVLDRVLPARRLVASSPS